MAELVLIYDGVIGSLLAKQVGTTHIADAAITSGKIGSGQVGSPHVAAGAIVSAQVGALAVGTPHLANQAVLSAKVGANVLATPHFQNQGILSASIGAESIGWGHLTSGAVASGKIGAGAILSASIGAQAVGLPHLVRGATSGQVLTAQGTGTDNVFGASPPPGPGSILSSHIGSGQVGAPHISPNAIISGKVASGSQDLSIVGYERPRVLLKQVIVNGILSGVSFDIPSGLHLIEIEMKIMPARTGLIGLRINNITSNMYNWGYTELGRNTLIYSSTVGFSSGIAIASIPDTGAGVTVIYAKATIPTFVSPGDPGVLWENSNVGGFGSCIGRGNMGNWSVPGTLSGLQIFAFHSGLIGSGSVIRLLATK